MELFHRPEVWVDTGIVSANIRKMKKRSDTAGVVLRPHFKTHQSKGIGELFRREGIEKITVSSVDMARYFASSGWEDILIAFPVNTREWDAIEAINSRIRIGMTLSDPKVLKHLPDRPADRFRWWIELDTGHHRSGFPAEQTSEILAMVDACFQKGFCLDGFLFHDGHTYLAKGLKEIEDIRHRSLELIASLRQELRHMFPEETFIFSGGDTPSCSHSLPSDGLDEWRPGNFVFYDLMQWVAGHCTPGEIAARMVCPVVAVYPDRETAIIYGGAVHLGKDFLSGPLGTKYYGGISLHGEKMLIRNGHPRACLVSLSQEHGVIRAPASFLKKLAPGDLLDVYPVHSCLMVSVAKRLFTHEGIVFDTLGGYSE